VDNSSAEEEELPAASLVAPDPLSQPQHAQHMNPRYFGSQFVNLAERDHCKRELAAHFDLTSSGDMMLWDLGSFLQDPTDWQTALHVAMHMIKVDKDGVLDGIHPLTFAAKANSKDMPNFYQAMNSNDAEGYYHAREQEFDLLDSKFQPWEIVPRSIAESCGKNILGTTCSFKCKRYPDGHVCKLKACLCIRGDQQVEGVNFFENYTPMVAWSTVHIC